MKTRAATRLAWSLWAVNVFLVAVNVLFIVLNRGTSEGDLGGGVPMAAWLANIVLAFATVGALVGSRRAPNQLGWILLAMGLAMALTFAAYGYALYSIFTHPGSLPGALVMAWFTNWFFVPGIGLFLLFFLLFPTGRLPSQRWRPVVWSLAAILSAGTLVAALMPGTLDDFPTISNPFGLTSAAELLGALDRVLFPILGGFALAAGASVVFRYRRAGVEERLQLKWFILASTVFVTNLLVNEVLTAFGINVSRITDIVGPLSMAGVPFAMGIAILKYRLY
ncbi:MAG: hypothetical protein ABIS18_09875, partial [Actinomycetota bacterium]